MSAHVPSDPTSFITFDHMTILAICTPSCSEEFVRAHLRWALVFTLRAAEVKKEKEIHQTKGRHVGYIGNGRRQYNTSQVAGNLAEQVNCRLMESIFIPSRQQRSPSLRGYHNHQLHCTTMHNYAYETSPTS